MRAQELITKTALDKTNGIYMIWCIPADKAYIGQSKNIKTRWSHHRYCLAKQIHGNKYLQRLYNKYGKDSFFFVVLENCIEDMSIREAFYIDQLDKETRLNLQKVTEVIPCTEEVRSKLSKARKGKQNSEEHNRKISETNKRLGKIPPSQKGIRKSDEHRRKLSEAMKLRSFENSKKVEEFS